MGGYVAVSRASRRPHRRPHIYVPGNPSCDDRAGLRHRLLYLENTLMSARGNPGDVIITIIDANGVTP